MLKNIGPASQNIHEYHQSSLPPHLARTLISPLDRAVFRNQVKANYNAIGKGRNVFSLRSKNHSPVKSIRGVKFSYSKTLINEMLEE